MDGIVPNVRFRLKGSSIIFRGDFYVSALLDSWKDIFHCWRFIFGEAKAIFDKAREIYEGVKSQAGKALKMFAPWYKTEKRDVKQKKHDEDTAAQAGKVASDLAERNAQRAKDKENADKAARNP